MVRNNVRFALTSANAVGGAIDMRDLEGQKNYENATRTLAKEGFDCKLDGLFVFLESLKAREKSGGWVKYNGIFKIPEKYTPANVNDLFNLYVLYRLRKSRIIQTPIWGHL